VSRYKLDNYLQTFDFPAPNISAEKRFTTTVPLQRLFLMNSDFMQIEAEELAKRVAGEADNKARITKVYQLTYGRDPNESEIKIGLEYLRSEPMKEYEESKKKPPEGAGKGGRQRGGAAASGETGSSTAPAGSAESTAGPVVAKPAPASPSPTAPESPETTVSKAEPPAGSVPEAVVPPDAAGAAGDAATAGAATENAGMGMGMMDGVPGMGGRRGNGSGGAPEVKYEPSVWGRYIKVLLSSSEFLFVN
jgi:hypothetical protein